jgi:hypothetical protein
MQGPQGAQVSTASLSRKARTTGICCTRANPRVGVRTLSVGGTVISTQRIDEMARMATDPGTVPPTAGVERLHDSCSFFAPASDTPMTGRTRERIG